VYGAEVLEPLVRLWAILDYPCGKPLTAVAQQTLEALGRHGELEVFAEVGGERCCTSAATMDRRLASEHHRLKVKGRSGTKPGSLLRQRIPFRSFADWDEVRPGLYEIDLVGHEGGSAVRQFCQTLTLTDVASG
jgi:hypothetical protein